MKQIGKLKFGAMALAVVLWAGAGFAQSNGNGNGNNSSGAAGSAGSSGSLQSGSSAGSGGSQMGAGAGAQSGYNGGNGQNGGMQNGSMGNGSQGSGAAGSGSGMQSGSNGGNGSSAGYLSSNFNARVPQYWVADASIFIDNAVNTAQVLEREQSLNVEDPQVFASQSEFMRNAVGRATNDLNGLLSNAMNTNPTAVPSIRAALAELDAALAQANTFAHAASNGELGPTYVVTIKSALAHLQASEGAINKVASDFGAQNFAVRNSGGNNATAASAKTGSNH